MRFAACLAAATLVAGATPVAGEALAGRYSDFTDAAMACVRVTTTEGVDRAALASAGWSDVASAEIDHNPVSWARRSDNPFVARINAGALGEAEHCWVSTEFDEQEEYELVRAELEARIGQAPDSVETEDMRETEWIRASNTVELWMMPEHELCGECPIMFVTVRPRVQD